eukprot:scaffold102443_cov35-Tisochrysis_lutea.AAC.1
MACSGRPWCSDGNLMLDPLGTGHAGASEMGPQEAAMRAELESIRQYHTNMAARIRELSNQLEATREQQANTRNSVGKILTFLSQVYHAHTQNGIAPAGLLANIAPITENKPMDSLVSASPPSDLGLQPIVEPTPARPMKRARIEDAEPRSSDDVAISELADLSSMPPPPMVKPQRSLGAEAARALPYDMQVCAMARRQCAHGPALADLAIASSRGRRRHLAKCRLEEGCTSLARELRRTQTAFPCGRSVNLHIPQAWISCGTCEWRVPLTSGFSIRVGREKNGGIEG